MSGNKALPDLIVTKRSIIQVVGKTGKAAQVPIPPAGSLDDYEKVTKAGYEVLAWGPDNDFPQQAELDITANAVLQRALEITTQVILGQGVYAVRVKGTSPTGEEMWEAENDPELLKILCSAWVTRYLSEAARDLRKFGTAFVQFRPALDGNNFQRLSVTNALHVRLEFPGKDGISRRVLLNGMWPDGQEVKAYPLLSEHDADLELATIVDKSKPVFYQIKNGFSSAAYYTYPNWMAAKTQRWLSVSNKTAKLVDAMLDNYTGQFLHIQIPYSYFEAKYPESEFDQTQRLEKIAADVRKLEDSLTTIENARSALTTFFDQDIPGSGLKIDTIEFKGDADALKNNTAADTQIAIASGVQPDIMGLMYGNSKGGSMQREILLLLYALSHSDRERILEPLELLLKQMNSSWADIELRFRQTFLTTLDTGAGTATV